MHLNMTTLYLGAEQNLLLIHFFGLFSPQNYYCHNGNSSNCQCDSNNDSHDTSYNGSCIH